jgi:eukaryotic-like serine/threonine-protein kinase
VNAKRAPDHDLTPESWTRVKEVFQAALEREPGLRTQFVGERCAGDSSLRKTVETLLAAHDAAGEFLETPSELARMAVGLFGRGHPTRALAVGSRLGPYEILALLEAGGMGEVYRARDVRLGREVAIKVLLSHLSKDPDRLRRFESEARSVGAISDPNIVTVFDVGWEEGKPYLVSELLEGETLGQRLRRGRLGVVESAEIAAQIAHGLAAAHEKDIVHRDLKPDNVFLTRQGPVKLLDFGVAKLIHDTPDEVEEATPGGGARSTLMGTPGYIAPEQLEGGAVDHRADIFALGAVLYRMLAGRSAFAEETTVEGLRATLTKEPPPFAPTDAVPEPLERIVRKCLAKRAEDRYPSAHELRLALLQFIRAPRRPGLRWVRPLGLAALAALLAMSFWFDRGRIAARKTESPPARARSVAVLPLESVSLSPDQEYFADGMTDALIAEIGRTNPKGLRVISRASVMPFKVRKIGVAQIGRELGVDTLVRGTVKRTGQEVRLTVQLERSATGQRFWAGTYEGRMSEIGGLQREVAVAIATQIAPLAPGSVSPPRRLEPQSVEAYEAYLRGRYYWNMRSEEGVGKAIDQFNHALELDPLYAQAYTGLADALVTLGDMLYLMPSQDAFAKAEAASVRALELEPSQAEAHATLGHLHMHAWRWTEAEREFQKAIDLNPGYATAYHWRAYNLASMGRPEEAVAAIERAQELDPLSLIINADVAQVLFFTGHPEEAVAQCRKTLQMNPGFAEARRVLFLGLQSTHHDEEALLEVRRYQALPDGGPGASVGWAYAVLGQRAEALAVLKEQEQRPQKQFVPPYALAVIHAGLGEVDRAFALLDVSVATHDTESMILPVDPRLDALRSDPRFAALLRRMGLPLS